MSRHINQIGFSQRVRLEWLEQTANLVLAENDKRAVNDALQELLKDKVSVDGSAERGTREKIITILLRVWLSTPSELEPLRITGLELLKRFPRVQRVAVHWGMVMAVYPFWPTLPPKPDVCLNCKAPPPPLIFSDGFANNTVSGRRYLGLRVEFYAHM